MSRAHRRPLLRAAAGGLAALLLAGLWGQGSALAQPLPTQPLPTQEGDAEAGADATAAELVVAPQDAVLSPSAEVYGFAVLVRNPGEEELAGGTLRLWLDTERLGSREELAALGGETGAGAGAEAPETGTDTDAGDAEGTAAPPILLVEAEAQATQAEGEQSLTVTVPREAVPLLDSGVYAVRAELVLDEGADGDAGGETDGDAGTGSLGGGGAPILVATTAVVWRGPATGERVPLSVVVPFVLPEDVRTMPTRDDLGRAAPRLDALLTAAERWRATLAVDPRIIAGIRAYGTAAPAAARDFLARLEGSALPMFLLQFADADPAAEAALGFDELLQPTGLAYLTRLGTFDGADDGGADDTGTEDADAANRGTGDNGAHDGEGAVDSEDPAAGTSGESDGESPDGSDEDPDPENPSAPGLDELLSWPTATAGAWPADGRANAETLELLRRAGATSLVLRSDNVVGAGSPRATVNGFDALIADARLGSAARLALAGASAAERAGGAATLSAELALAAADATEQSPGLVLGLDRAAVADAEEPAALLDTLEALGWLTPANAAELPRGSAALQDGAISEERQQLLEAALEASDRIDALAPLLERPGYLTQYQRIRLLEAFATRYAGDEVDLAAVEERNRERDEELLAGVQVVPSENTQLVGTESRVPVLVRNSLPFDARVTLRATPSSAAIRVPDRLFPDQAVDAESNATVLVPVLSRVSSGESGLFVEVADAEDDAVFFRAMLRLTIRSSYETIMLATLGALAALLLGFGVWRSVRRRRSTAAGGE